MHTHTHTRALTCGARAPRRCRCPSRGASPRQSPPCGPCHAPCRGRGLRLRSTRGRPAVSARKCGRARARARAKQLPHHAPPRLARTGPLRTQHTWRSCAVLRAPPRPARTPLGRLLAVVVRLLLLLLLQLLGLRVCVCMRVYVRAAGRRRQRVRARACKGRLWLRARRLQPPHSAAATAHSGAATHAATRARTSSYTGLGLGLGAEGGGALAMASCHCAYACACACALCCIVAARSGICCCTICMMRPLICGGAGEQKGEGRVCGRGRRSRA